MNKAPNQGPRRGPRFPGLLRFKGPGDSCSATRKERQRRRRAREREGETHRERERWTDREKGTRTQRDRKMNRDSETEYSPTPIFSSSFQPRVEGPPVRTGAPLVYCLLSKGLQRSVGAPRPAVSTFAAHWLPRDPQRRGGTGLQAWLHRTQKPSRQVWARRGRTQPSFGGRGTPLPPERFLPAPLHWGSGGTPFPHTNQMAWPDGLERIGGSSCQGDLSTEWCSAEGSGPQTQAPTQSSGSGHSGAKRVGLGPAYFPFISPIDPTKMAGGSISQRGA